MRSYYPMGASLEQIFPIYFFCCREAGNRGALTDREGEARTLCPSAKPLPSQTRARIMPIEDHGRCFYQMCCERRQAWGPWGSPVGSACPFVFNTPTAERFLRLWKEMKRWRPCWAGRGDSGASGRDTVLLGPLAILTDAGLL